MPRKSDRYDAASFTVPSSPARKRIHSSSQPSSIRAEVLSDLHQATGSPLLQNVVSAKDALSQRLSHGSGRTDAWAEAVAPELCSLQSLFGQHLMEPDWVIPGLLPTGVSLLASSVRLDKSLLAYQLGLSVASGQPFLGHFPVCQGRVLYLALAENFQQIRGRTLRLLSGLDYPSDFLFAFKWSPLRTSGLADLEDTLATLTKTRLLIIDPLELLLPTQSVPGFKARFPVMPVREPGFFLPLRELAERYRLAILLLHHVSEDWPDRNDLLAGPSLNGFTNASVCNLLLSAPRHSVDALLHIAGPQVQERRMALLFNEQWDCMNA